ncbi:MAG: transcription termination/antitermination NusG family protein [Ketobacteraceae bacterium]|nr:transcription termination/antitermination NusG family protein [Ketobacteraceae bacterium]
MVWLVVRTKSKQEGRAVQHLTNQALTTYCPQLIRDNGESEPLFPGYLFVEYNENNQLHLFRSTRGVLNLVKYGDRFAIASDDLINAIRQKENQFIGMPTFKAQQKITITKGAFSGLDGIYLCKRSQDRALILLSLLNRKQSIEIKIDALEALS